MNYKTQKIKSKTKLSKKQKGGAIINNANNVNLLDKSLSIASQTASKVGDYALNNVAILVGVDPNKSTSQILSETVENISTINNALNSPEGKKLLDETKQLVKTTSETIIAPATKEISEQLVSSLGNITESGTKAIVNAAEEIPGVGIVLGTARTLGNLADITSETTKLTDKVLEKSNNVINDIKQKQPEINGIVNRMTNLVNNETQNRLENMKQYNNNFTNTLSKNIQRGGKIVSLKTIHNGGKKITRRILKSKLDFLSSKKTNYKRTRKHK